MTWIFFGKRPFEAQEILDEMHDLAPVTIMSQSKNILVLNVREVKVGFVNYRYPIIAPPVEVDGLRLLSIQDIGAMKLTAVAGRGRKRDFYDLYFLLRQYALPELMGFYLQKFEDGSEFMVVRSLTYFEDADQDEKVTLLKKKVKWEAVKKAISNEVRKYYRDRMGRASPRSTPFLPHSAFLPLPSPFPSPESFPACHKFVTDGAVGWGGLPSLFPPLSTQATLMVLWTLTSWAAFVAIAAFALGNG